MAEKFRTNYARHQLPDADLNRQRLALVSMSLVLIIFALAGGHVKKDTTLLGLPIEFSRPNLLLWAAWIIWGYHLYKFRLTTTPPWKQLGAEIYLRAIAKPAVHAMCLPALPRFDIAAPYRAQAHRQLTEQWTFAITKHEGVWSFDPMQMYRPATQASPSGAAGQIGYFPLSAEEIRTFRNARVIAALEALALEWSFTEKVLPYLLILLTPLIWVVAYGRPALDLMINLVVHGIR
jgi:hypothetical protein